MIVRRHIDPFLGESRPVELATQLVGDGRIATRRYEPSMAASYGTSVEIPVSAPTAGRAMHGSVSILGPSATRLRFHHDSPASPTSLVEPRDEVPLDADSAASANCVVGDERFTLTAAHGRLVMRGDGSDALDRMNRLGSTWPSHEQRWQVVNRFAYPLGCTADGDPAAWFASFELHPGEQIFGLGEDFGPLQKRGTTHHLWSQEAFSNSSPAVYKPVPFWWSTAGYGVIVNTTNPVRVDVGGGDHSAISVVVDGADQLDLVVIEGETPADILATYVDLTGRPRVPPAWSFGVWMSRISYTTQDEVEQVAAEMAEHDIPCDVLHLDTAWFADDWNCDYQFCPDRFHDPEGMIARLADLGVRVSLWQWPNALMSTSVFEECRELGILATDPDSGEPVVQDGFVGPAGVIDYSDPRAVEWIGDKLRPLLQMGVAAIKTDFGEGAPTHARYHSIDGMAMHNAYPLLYNAAVMAVSEEVHGDEAVVWSRSGWAGSQRYPVHWSGDGIAHWSDLPTVLRSMLSFGLSGMPFYGHDVGGFSGVPEPDLYVRWAQLGACSSHLRFHGFGAREPWEFGPAAAAIVRDTLHLRKRLQPYLVEQATAAATGMPLCRAMVLAYPHDPTCGFLDDQYLLGNDLLVAPILSASGRRKVYVPEPGWYDWWTGEEAPVGWHEVAAPLDQIPLWRRRDFAERHHLVPGTG